MWLPGTLLLFTILEVHTTGNYISIVLTPPPPMNITCFGDLPRYFCLWA